MRPNTNNLKPGRGIVLSSLGTALALLVLWLSSCTLYVAVERVDRRMRWNWIEGLTLNFLTATGPALGHVSAGWPTAKVNCLCFSGQPSLAKTAAQTRDCSFSSVRWRSFSATALYWKPGAYSSSMALLLMMLTLLVREMNGF